MSDNSPKATPWAKYRLARIAHARELQQLAAAYRDKPRCSKCQIVIDLKPIGPCCIADCPLASTTSIAAPTP